MASHSSQIARLKANLEAKTKAQHDAAVAAANAETGKDLLQGHFHITRTQAERERIQIETAKKMASRFNLTYRALALSAAKKTAEHRLKDIQAAREAKERAAKYQMTARSLQMSSTGTSTGRVNVLSFDDGTRYSQAYTMDDDLSMYDDDTLDYMPRKFTELSTLMSSDDLYSFEQETSSDAAKVEEMVFAVKTFFEEHDATRIAETESLVQTYAGREDELLDELNRQYPPHEASKD